MALYGIGETFYQGEKLVEVSLQCLDQPEEPYFHLHECEIASVGDVVRLLKQGEQVVTIWRLPEGSSSTFPVEIVTLSDGDEAIEVVQRGQREGYRIVNLPRRNSASGDVQGLA